MKKIFFITSFIICIFIININVFAMDGNFVRIGLEEQNLNKESISVDNTGLGLFGTDVSISSSSGFVFHIENSVVARINTPYTTYQTALSACNNYTKNGYSAAVAYCGQGKFYVYICGKGTSGTFDTSKLGNVTVMTPSNSRLSADYGQNKIIFENMKDLNFIPSNNELIKIGTRTYRGMLEFTSNTPLTITPVNYIDLEQYLYSVVPSEMPSTWKLEALKAQSVAARTYTYASLSNHPNSDYDLCDTVHCQAYVGAGNESPFTTEAVDETKGLEAYYNGSLIDAVFSSSDGGVTASSQDVWENSFGYLTEKLDQYDKEGKVWSRTLSMDDIKALTVKNGDNIGDIKAVSISRLSQNGRVNELTLIGTMGNKVLTKENIRYYFANDQYPSLQSRYFTILNGSITINTTTESQTTDVANGNVYIYQNGNVISKNLSEIYILSNYKSVLKGSGVLIGKSQTTSNVLGLGGSSTAGTTSSTVTNPPITIPNKVVTSIGNTITFAGKGWGHGVGMSQYGAKGMAEAGFGYQDILKFYYTGIEIK